MSSSQRFIVADIANIKYLIKAKNITKFEDWNGECFDGLSTMEYIIDPYFKNWVRIAVNNKEVILLNKKYFNEAIAEADLDAINKKIAQRKLSNHEDDFLEFYWELYVPIIEKASGIELEIYYVNAFDYISDIAFDEEIYQKYINELSA